MKDDALNNVPKISLFLLWRLPSPKINVSQICYKTGKVHLSSVILTYVQSYKKTGHKSVQVKPPI